MSYFDPRHGSSTLETVLSLSGTVIRNWRTRGFLSGIGTIGPNGRWTYSDSDILTIACGRVFLADGATSVSQALTLAAVIQLDVLLRLFPNVKCPVFLTTGQFISVSIEPDGAIQRTPVVELSKTEIGSTSLLSLVDIDVLVGKLPVGLSEILTALSDQEAENLFSALSFSHGPTHDPRSGEIRHGI